MDLTIWLTVPQKSYSPVDYLLENLSISYLKELPRFPRVAITESGLTRMALDPFLSHVKYSDEMSLWTGAAITIAEKFYPELQYVLDGHNILWIRYDGKELFFNPSGEEVIEIDYRSI